MLAAAAWRTLAPALVLLLVGCADVALGALENAALDAGGPAATGVCEEPVAVEPGVKSVHCTSPLIAMTPGQVCTHHSAVNRTCQDDGHKDAAVVLSVAGLLSRPDTSNVFCFWVQVININLLYPNPFPADQTVAIINQTAQLIHVADKLPVSPNEVRPCNAAMFMHSM